MHTTKRKFIVIILEYIRKNIFMKMKQLKEEIIMKQKGITFLLTGCLLLSLFPENTVCASGIQTKEKLQVSYDIDWDDEGNPSLRENAEYHSVEEIQGADIRWDAVWSIKNGDDYVSADSLNIYKQNADNESYKKTDSVTVKAAGENLLRISFAECGMYHINLNNAEIKEHSDAEEDSDSCIKVDVGYPEIALYTTENISANGIVKDSPIEYQAGDTWYVHTSAGAGNWRQISDVSFEFLSGADAFFDIETITENKKYKITAKETSDVNDVGILYKCKVVDANDTANSWDTVEEQWFTSKEKESKQGLLATDWMYWNEDTEENLPSDDINGFNKFKWTSLECELCLKYNSGATDDTETGVDDEGNSYTNLVTAPIPANKIKIYVKNDDGKLVEAPSEIASCKQSGKFIHFSFANLGTYIVGYTPEGGVESHIVLDVGYPGAAFYTSDACTENGLIRDQFNYSRKNRTIYYVIHQEKNEEDNKMYPEVVKAPTFVTNEDATVEKQSDTVYKITVNPGVTNEFDVIAKDCSLKDTGDTWDEYSEIHLCYEKIPEITSLTIKKKNIEVEAGKTTQLDVDVKSVESEGKKAKVTYASSDASVATVDANGKVTGIKAGMAEITVTAALGESTKTEKATVVVKENSPTAQQKVKAVDGSTVTTAKNGTAVVNAVAAKKKAKSVKIPDKVVVNGVEYRVMAVSANAFKPIAKTITSITLPATITRIDKNAFKNLTKLKKITMKGTGKVSVAKGAFKGVNTKKVTISVSMKMNKKVLKKFKADLKKAGFKGTVKAIKG